MPGKLRLSLNIEDYWKTKEGRSKVLENIDFICLPISGNIDFSITRTEHWEIIKPSRIKKYTSDTYLITLPGVSISELMKGNNLCTICKDFEGQVMVSMNLLMNSNNDSNLLGTAMKFEHTDVEKAFVLLMKNGLIKAALDFHGDETRYVLADGRLRDFIEALRNIHEREFDLLFHKWSFFEEPSKDEQSRINRLRAFKETRIRVPASKKDLKKDVLKYDEYLKKVLEVDLEDLYHDPDSEGVDFIWLIHGLTIQKYEFLQDIIRVICPRIIEVAEDETRLSKIDKDRLEIFPGWEGKQPKLSDSPSIYVHDQASLIAASITDDPVARRKYYRIEKVRA